MEKVSLIIIIENNDNNNNNNNHNNNNERPKRKTWTREDNQLALHCYLRSNLSQWGYRKTMIEIWPRWVNFLTSQGLADQVWTIIKMCWIFDLEILEIDWKTHKQNDNTVSNISRGVKQKQLSENELLTSENDNTTLSNTTLPNNAQPNKH